MGKSSDHSVYIVTPAKAGVHHRRNKFQRQVMDPRLTDGQFILSACLGRQSKGGNDEFWGIGSSLQQGGLA
jgi:hypothetical protein